MPVFISHKAMLLTGVLFIIALPTAFGEPTGFSLKGTVWERAALNAPCKIEPELLFSLALKESHGAVSNGLISPQPYALRNGQSGPAYPKTQAEAEVLLTRYLQEDKLTDIGIMQINCRWNCGRVRNANALLNPVENIKVGAAILCESISANPADMQLAIGGYHTMNPTRELDARLYARDVIAIWRSIQMLKK
ncbi:transglycosylase SLT domain-containing protein [Pseudomonas nitroreducens]|uniref:Transglycosylase SLT domain-containing protein n=1 Tax=Pseudomonas nitroreducens TaxID=46680 RepID=A0ABS0KIB4_PSENT|nr:transglycosylase SLT domain-containing protein [Pseudomonas nitroreducens]MBG6287809.1 transglycosylase SLT domain-containing protein [Pseudomonas nitroreducens]MDG9857921.1 transglycosylase SLT domain-containing protein [Pseudomonas nitroreducens]